MENPEQRESVIDLSPRNWDSGKLRPELRQRLGGGLIIPEKVTYEDDRGLPEGGP